MSLRLILSAVVVIAASSAVTQVSAQQSEHAVFYFSFDNGTFPVPDDSGKGLLGENVGDVAVYSSDAKFGSGAMDFGGFQNNAFLQVDSDTAFQSIMSNDSFTVSLHQKWGDGQPNANVTFRAHDVASIAGADRLIGTHTPWSNGQVYLDTGGCCDGTANRVNGAWDGGAVGEWSHFAFRKEGENTSIWIDGAEFLAEDGKVPLDNRNLFINQFTIGGAPAEGGNSFNGLMDDFAVWDVALTDEEIIALSTGPVSFGLPGDVNEDGFTNSTDFDILSGNMGNSPAEKTDGDLNNNDIVDLPDFRIWKNHDGCFAVGDSFECPPEGLAASGTVPEPTGLALMVLAGVGGAFWRARRRR